MRQVDKAKDKQSGRVDYDKIERDEAEERTKLEEDMLLMAEGMKNIARGF